MSPRQPKSAAAFVSLTALALLAMVIVWMQPQDATRSNTDVNSLPPASPPTLAETKAIESTPTPTGPPVRIDFKLLDETKQPDARKMEVVYPPALEALDGHLVELIAFMAPFESLEDMSECLMLPAYVGCFFCAPPSFTQVVFVRQKDDGRPKKPFIEAPSLVTGTLRLLKPGSSDPAHEMEMLYVVTDATVVPYDGSNAPARVPGHWQQENPRAAADAGLPEKPQPLPPMKPEDLVPVIAKLRGLEIKKPIKFTTYTPAELESAVEVRINSRRAAGGWAAHQRVWQTLGFADEKDDLRLVLRGLTLQRVIGYSNAAGDHIRYNADLQLTQPATRLELVKVIAEALLRQNHDLRHLDAALHGDTNTDARLAATALLQGDLMTTARLFAAHHRLRDPSPNASFAFFGGYPAAKTALQQLETLPWQMGPFFTDQFAPNGEPMALNDLLKKPPTTTAAIIHPIFHGRPQDYTPVEVPSTFADALRDSKPIATGILGEAALLVWLENNAELGPHMSAADGWRGDRYAFWQDGTLLIETHWLDEDEAAEFHEAATTQRPDFTVIRKANSSLVHLIGGPEAARAELQKRLQP
ncbi:MAG: DUF3299 domain-containing protein [Verrucomicrobiaceae bacterium]|nr:DUF3299 domain-containing protein [Verrucomicrobiaceae bacterium]